MTDPEWTARLEERLVDARREAVRAVSVADSLARLWSLTIETSARLGRPVDVDDLVADAERQGEEARARLQHSFDVIASAIKEEPS